MNHDIGSIKYIVPIRNMLYVDKVDNTAIHEPIQNVTCTSTDYEAEADILVALDRWTKPEVGAHADQQSDANRGEYPAHSL